MQFLQLTCLRVNPFSYEYDTFESMSWECRRASRSFVTQVLETHHSILGVCSLKMSLGFYFRAAPDVLHINPFLSGLPYS